MTKLNIDLFQKVVDYITAHPEEHDQSDFIRERLDDDDNICGTALCFAGHAGVLSGEYIVENAMLYRTDGGGYNIDFDAQRLLGITDDQAWHSCGPFKHGGLFSGHSREVTLAKAAYLVREAGGQLLINGEPA